MGGFTLWATTTAGSCDAIKSFNSMTALIDTANPGNSQLIAAITGGDAAHPIKPAATDPTLVALQAFAADAAATAAAATGGGTTADPGASPYDFAVFQSTVEPALDKANCARSGCHAAPGQNGFALTLAPAADSDAMKANFKVVTARGELSGDPSTSIFYVQATVAHSGGASSQIDASVRPAVLAWLTAAKTAAGGAGNDANNCPPISGFNVGVFNSEILPILEGTLDLNAADKVGHGGGCVKSGCHGQTRGAGTLSLIPGTDPAQLLANFACFVNLATPQLSEALLCPSDQDGCRKRPHPGGNFFDGGNDLNYQRLLSYIYGSKLNISPLDYAFFVRKVNPIFNDLDSVEGGALNLTCADATQCHGISVAGSTPPNGSDFGIIGNAGDDASLTLNFVSAASFANFIQPSESSLFLYPTDEISDTVNHKLATGAHHPGGLDFDQNSDLAKLMLTWVAGLKPDGQGFVLNWLVQGDFTVTQLIDRTAIDEATVNPRIFDLGSGSFNQGQWDGLFSDSQTVDLLAVFGNKPGINRVVYASANVISNRAQDINLAITTDNPVQVWIDGHLIAQNQGSGGVQAFTSLPLNKAVHILLKVQQRATDAQFNFKAQTVDNNNVPLTDVLGGLFFTLAPNGGL
jgi:hypothetical protein